MTHKNKETTLLDSSLISKYNTHQLHFKSYNLKVVDCGDYVIIYEFENVKHKELDTFKDIKKIDVSNLSKKSNLNTLKSIELKNAIRSNLSVQRLARCNCDSWYTFITLTFEKNITDISKANKLFNQFISNIRKLKKDFKYLAVPEFQKRGAVHYHLLSNLNYDDNIIIEQKEKKGRAVFINSIYDIKYWNHGFCRVDFIKNDYSKIFKYLTKYMTKDIDDKLFGKKRYLYSQNLKKPVVNYINSNDSLYLEKLLNDKDIDYFNEYLDVYSKTNIKYYEFKKKTIF